MNGPIKSLHEDDIMKGYTESEIIALKIVRANEVTIREFVGDLIFKMAHVQKFV